MTLRFRAATDESVLLRIECQNPQATLVAAGELVLTNRRLVFEAHQASKLLGARDWQAELVEILECRPEEQDGVLSLRTSKGSRRIVAKGALGLLARLELLLHQDESRPEPAEDARPLKALLRGSGRLKTSTGSESTGQLLLTERELRFTSAGSLSEQGPSLQVGLGEIQDLWLSEPRRLVITVGEEVYELAGRLAPQLHELLSTLRDPKARQAATPVTPATRPLAVWSASRLGASVVARRGDLVASQGSIRFVEESKQEQARGLDAQRVSIPMPSIRSVEIRGLLGRRLVVHTKDEEHVFSVDSPEDALEHFGRLMIQSGQPGEPALTSGGELVDTGRIEALLKPWGRSVSGLKAENNRLCGPVVYHTNRWCLRRGWICVIGERILILPVERESSAGILSVSLSDVRFPGPEADQGVELVLRTKTIEIRALPRGGQPFIDRFWDIWESKVHPDLPQRSPTSNRREAYRVRLLDPIRSILHCYDENDPDSPELVAVAWVRDLSVTGCGFFCTEEVSHGSLIQVDLPYRTRLVRLRGRVVWSDEGDEVRGRLYGVRLTVERGPRADLVRRTVMSLQEEEIKRQRGGLRIPLDSPPPREG